MTPDRILIVEDDETVRQATHMQLVREGYEVVSAGSAEEAIAILDKTPQQLVIADLNLPGLSGLELLQTIRLEHPESTVIVMTAYGTIKTAVDAVRRVRLCHQAGSFVRPQGAGEALVGPPAAAARGSGASRYAGPEVWF